MSEEKDKLVVIPLEIINEVLVMLSSRPYSEVSEVIKRLQSSAQVIDREDNQDADNAE